MTDNPWTPIRERLETATEGSEELDVAITRALCGYGPDDPLWYTQKFSRDLNAIVAAVEAEPLINCHGYDKDPTGIQAHVSRNNVSEGHFLFEGTQSTPCLALCLAFAKMKEAAQP